MPRMLHHDTVVKLFVRAINGGGVRRSLSHVEWDISGDCHNRYLTEVVGRPEAKHGKYWTYVHGKQMTMQVDIWTRCRKCPACAKAKANLWHWRAKRELQRAARSWFGTLTLSPVAQYRVLSEARAQG